MRYWSLLLLALADPALVLALLPLAGHAQVQPWPAGAVPHTTLDSVRYLRSRARVELHTEPAAARRTDQQALRRALRLGDLRLISNCWRGLGDTYDSDQSIQAQHCYEQALAAARQARWAEGMGEAYMGLGLTATDIHDRQRALRFFQQATQYYEAMPATAANQAARARNRLLVLTNQINAYYQLNDRTTAARLCRQALALREQTLATAPSEAWRQQFSHRNAHATCTILSLQADLYQEVNQLDSARRCAEHGLRLSTDTESQANLRINLTGIALAQHRPAAAYQHLRLALQLARHSGYPGPLQDGLELLPRVLHALHRPEAYDSLQAYVAYQDSANAQTRLEAIAEAQARFDSREQQARIRALEQQRRLTTQALELAQLRTRYQLAGGTALLLLVLLLGGGFFARYRRRQAAARAAAATALRTRLAADLHDDVGNLLTQISMQSDLLRESPLMPAPLLARLDTLTSTARRATQQMSDAIWGLAATAPTLPALLDHMRDHAHEVLQPLDLEPRFDTHPVVPALDLSAEARQALYLIFKEALHNIVKHAQPSEVLITLVPAPSGGLSLTIRNDGPAAAVPARPEGQGLASMQARAAAVGGRVQYPAQAAGFVVEAVV